MIKPLGELGREVRVAIQPRPGRRYELYSVPAFGSGSPEIIDGREIKSAKRSVEVGDILICKINPRINRIWRVQEPKEPIEQIASPEYLIFRPLDPAMADYLMWYCRSPLFRDWLTSHVEGVTGSHTRVKSPVVLRHPVPVPPIDEQRKIVAAIEEQLSRLEAAKADLASAGRRLQTLGSALLSSALLQLPAQAGESSPETGLPLRWTWMRIGSFLREPLRNGHSATASGNGLGVRTLTLTAVTKRHFSETHTKLTSADPERVKDLWLRAGDLLIERSNTPDLVGTAALYEGPDGFSIFPDLLIRIRPDGRVLPAYLEVVLRAPATRAYFRKVAKGISGSMPKIDQRDIEALWVPVPPVDEQTAIVTAVRGQFEVLDRLADVIRKALKRAERFRAALLASAFTGNLVSAGFNSDAATVLAGSAS